MTTKVVTVKCPFCDSEKVSKNGHNVTGKQVYRCNNPKCKHYSFVEKYTYNAYNSDVREKILTMAVNGTGTRATSRILGISQNTVTSTFKKLKIGSGK